MEVSGSYRKLENTKTGREEEILYTEDRRAEENGLEISQ